MGFVGTGWQHSFTGRHLLGDSGFISLHLFVGLLLQYCLIGSFGHLTCLLMPFVYSRRFLTCHRQLTVHCQKLGRDIETSAAVRYQLWSGLDGFNLAFVRNLYFIFVSVLPTPCFLICICFVILRQQFFDSIDWVIFDFRKHFGKPLYGFYVV